MSKPKLELIPLQAGVASDRPTQLTVLARITPPIVPLSQERPPINLGLVLDRSGSMAGAKLKAAKQAAQFAIQQLLPSDRVSLTVFDDEVQIPLPSTLVTDKAKLLRIVEQVTPGGCTALHEGWLQGGIQVSQHLSAQQLNRVIVLSDGLANVGETDPAVIASHVQGLNQRGVSTTTMGIGNDYNEDLLAAMASAGDGNFFHIESPQQLPDFFATELQGLMATVARQVSLGIRPQGTVQFERILNDLAQTEAGNWMLPNLISGSPVEVVFQLQVPPQAISSASPAALDVVSVRLAWNPSGSSQRQSFYQRLQLPVLRGKAIDELPSQPEVEEQVQILQAAQARSEAIAALDSGNITAAAGILNRIKRSLSNAPATAPIQTEMAQIEALQDQLGEGKLKALRKQARYQEYNAARSRKS